MFDYTFCSCKFTDKKSKLFKIWIKDENLWFTNTCFKKTIMLRIFVGTPIRQSEIDIPQVHIL